MNANVSHSRNIILIIVISAVFVIITALISACSCSKSDDDATQGEYKQIEKRTIANSVSATGKIKSVNSEEVTSSHIGSKVKAVYVKEGDTVSPGQVICQFDTTLLQEQLNNLRKSIAEAKADSAQRSVEYDNRINEASANRLQSIADTESRLNTARVEYLQALNELEIANKNYNDYLAVPGHYAYDSNAIQLQTVISAKQSNVDLKQATIESYEQSLNNLMSSDGSTFADAKESYDEASAGTIKSLEEQARELEKSIGECTVRSTIGGTITELNVKSGDNFLTGPICLIEGVNDLMIEAEVSEYDVPDVAVGMKVMIKTEATRDAELTGFVTYVAPKAKDSGSGSGSLGAISGLIGGDMSSLAGLSSGGSGSSMASYVVKVSLNDPNPRLRLGMNAKLSIITESVDDAISVPYDAVRDDGNGNKYVEIATNYDEAKESDGKIDYENKMVNVITGIKGSYYIQVYGDVKVGDYVYVPATEGEDSLDEIMNMMGSSAGV